MAPIFENKALNATVFAPTNAAFEIMLDRLGLTPQLALMRYQDALAQVCQLVCTFTALVRPICCQIHQLRNNLCTSGLVFNLKALCFNFACTAWGHTGLQAQLYVHVAVVFHAFLKVCAKFVITSAEPQHIPFWIPPQQAPSL